MSSSGSGSSAANTTAARGPYATPRSSVPYGLVVVHFIVGLYIPVAVALFVRRRRLPSIRQTNPVHVTWMGIFGGTYCLTSSGTLLFYDAAPMPIGTFTAVTTTSFLWLMFTAFASEILLVLKYIKTKLTVKIHESPGGAHLASCRRLHGLLAPCVLVTWTALAHMLWVLPTIMRLLDAPADIWTLDASWDDPVATEINNTIILQCASLLLCTSVVGCWLGTVNNTFTLHRVYLVVSRCIAACFIGYLVAIVIVPATRPELRNALTTTMAHVAVHVVLLPVLATPLLRTRFECHLALRSAHFNEKDSWEAVNADLLTLYLATPAGLAQYTAFMEVQLLPVAWLLAYNDLTTRNRTPQSLYNMYLHPQSVLSMRSFVPEGIRGELDITFCRGVLTATSDDLYVMYDPIKLRLLRALVLHTLPQFLHHPLGHVWGPFVDEYGGQYSPDDLLLNGAGYLGPFGSRKPLSTIQSQRTYTN
ncbi:hypothetical protein ACHHYP_04011 [Achlya hypogyna]|uniref:Transmembrane protein n=1 Tax=Achlya hypogyna TaxID=1202772 RepID=A0A1V9Z2F0_ACHHY|nr:hypothetical protein ACHHYP_04011 [Achlya hypogyna]